MYGISRAIQYRNTIHALMPFQHGNPEWRYRGDDEKLFEARIKMGDSVFEQFIFLTTTELKGILSVFLINV